MSNQDPSENLKSKVHNWLKEGGWKLQEVADPQFSWAFVVERTGFKLNVAQQEGKSDQCIVRITTNLVAAKSALAMLSQDEVDELIWQLRFEFARQEVEFEGVESPLEQVAISRTIYSDGLTKNSFTDTLGKVLRAFMLLRLVLTRRLGNISDSGWVN